MEEVVFKREGGEEALRCEGGSLHEKIVLSRKQQREDWCEEILLDGLGPCESTGRTGPGRGANREAKAEETDCGSGESTRCHYPCSWEVNRLEVEEEISTMATFSGLMECGQANGGKCRR